MSNYDYNFVYTNLSNTKEQRISKSFFDKRYKFIMNFDAYKKSHKEWLKNALKYSAFSGGTLLILRVLEDFSCNIQLEDKLFDNSSEKQKIIDYIEQKINENERKSKNDKTRLNFSRGFLEVFLTILYSNLGRNFFMITIAMVKGRLGYSYPTIRKNMKKMRKLLELPEVQKNYANAFRPKDFLYIYNNL